MFRILVLFSVIFSYSLCSVAQPVKDKLEHLMDGFAKDGNFNGTVLVARKGAVLLEKGYGYLNIEKQIKNDENSIYRIGQATEALTAEVILQLDSKGQLGLDEKIIKYIPGFPDGQKISIKNLLTHTSGIDNYIPDTRIQKNNVCRPINMAAFIEAYQNKPLLFEPGTKYAYTNADYILLGFIIEKISKVHYEDEMSFKIFTVCGMRHSGFDFYDLKDANKASGYDYTADNKFSEVRPAGDTGILFAADAMYTTVGDLYKWHEALRWYKLLPKDWQELAYVPLKGQFALGWNINRMYNKRFMEHEGSYAGFTSCVLRQEDDDVFVAVLENKMQAGYANSNIAKDILKILYGPEPKKKDNKEPASEPDTDPSLKKYTGKFLFNTNYYLTFKLNGDNLTVESPDEQPITLEAESATMFKTKGADVKIEFVPDQRGHMNKAILHQNGQDYTGKRIK